ncbi:MAG: acyl-CoA thioesterase [Methanobacteriota archaeon]|jgi:acyl-CoA thioesterase YciA|nr:acyl-CoA thioesterase [Candidatus Poseidoniia archaeon]PBO81120.1 MAG: acyl-CoA thioesterase [Euryarchaeota archaeon]
MIDEISPLTSIPTLRQLAMPKDTNALGTIFGGVILSQIDQAAAIEAHKYHKGAVVTVAMDEIEFKQPVFVGDVVSYYTRIHKLGRTSVTINVYVYAQRQFAEDGDFLLVTQARVVMVAVDSNNHPIAMNKNLKEKHLK